MRFNNRLTIVARTGTAGAILAFAITLLAASPASAQRKQITDADYSRAAQLLGWNTRDRWRGVRLAPTG